MRKPLIGINADFKSPQNSTPAFSYVATGYYDCISKAGGIPVIVPPVESQEDTAEILDRLDGFMLVGGPDLDPRNDGFMLHPAVRKMEIRRENFDRMLAAMIVERQMPVFGIGVGMQLLNVTLGGNLYLHIPEDLPGAIPHKDPQDPGHRHSLDITPNSVMERVYGDGEIRVSSRHHMAVDEVAENFAVTARCPDGVIEAIESLYPEWFAIATQFHPESDAASALDMRVFEEFLDGVKNNMESNLRLVAA